MKRFLMTAVAIPVLMLTACSTTPSVPDATAAACAAMGTFAQAVKSFDALGPTSTIQDYKDGAQAIQTAWTGVESATATLKDAKVDAVKTAATDLQTTVTSIPSSSTVIEAKASVAASVASLNAAITAAQTSLKCTPAP